MTFRPWERAWADALYGPAGFYHRPEGPAGHFRTAAHAAPAVLGAALARLARSAGCRRVVDVGAGRGELLTAVHAADPGLDLLAVDLVARPAGLAPGIGWAGQAPDRMSRTLLVGWELLDVVPCPVLAVDEGGVPRVVEVDDTGHERLGAAASAQDLAWCERWWPVAQPGDRVEVGHTRDDLWRSLVDRVDGLALAVDYGHVAGRRPATGSLTGYRAGRQVPPVPDGSCDLTAHVALDALGGVLTPQHRALDLLGVGGLDPSPSHLSRNPVAHLAALAAASQAHELLDTGGLGGFGWVLHPQGEAASRIVTEWTRGASA